MTGDVDLLAEHPEAVARELAGALHELFGIAVRVPEIGGGKAFRVYQVRKEGNRHLADVRRLLLSHPELRREPAGVTEAIRRIGGDDDALKVWRQLLGQPLVSDEETDEGY